MRDFTLQTYNNLLSALKSSGYEFHTVQSYLRFKPDGKAVIIRHDVDAKPGNSLQTGLLEHSLGIKATYYFRMHPKSFHPEIIKELHGLGHEIGYHYEDLATCGGNVETAVNSFVYNLLRLRELAPVKTICMHGSPLSKFNNMDILSYIDFKELEIIGEPYRDIDFTKVNYFTDTGRRWDGQRFSVRDKVAQKKEAGAETTFQLIKLIETGRAGNKLLITTHPQRWDDKFCPWLAESVLQRIKNLVKWLVVVCRKK